MSEMFELRSVRWQALQRTLAQGLGLEHSLDACATRPAATAGGGTWLARARGLMAPPAGSSAPT